MDNQTTPDAGVLPLQTLYLRMLVLVAEKCKLQAAMLDRGNAKGTLYLMPAGATKPEAIIGFEFHTSGVRLVLATRDAGRQEGFACEYTEGIDALLPQIERFIQAGRLAAPRRAAR